MKVSNKNLIINSDCSYNGYEIFIGKGGVILNYMDILYKVLNNSLKENNRVLAIRVDLRLPSNFCNNDTSVISRFFASLKAKIAVDYKAKSERLNRVHDCNMRYVWVKEQVTSKQPHYHVVIFVNYDYYHVLGDFNNIAKGGNLASRIAYAWASAIKADIGVAATLVHFPDNCTYKLAQSSEDFDKQLSSFINRVSYLAKIYTKNYGFRQRNIGYSQN